MSVKPMEPTRPWESLARAAGAGDGEQELAPRLEFVRFELDGAPYAVPIERVREVVRLRPITPVPRVPDWVRGVISLRGEIVQVVDLRSRLGMRPIEPSRTTRIVVLHGDDGSVAGLLVDTVKEVLRIEEAAVSQAPEGEGRNVAALLSRAEEFVSLLDVDRVLGDGS